MSKSKKGSGSRSRTKKKSPARTRKSSKPQLAIVHYDDEVQPFLIHHSNINGKLVRLGNVADTILTRHNYPTPVSKLLAETLVIAAMLSSSLKRDGILTLQINGEGPIKFLVVDAEHGGGLRGYAELAEGGEAKLAQLQQEKKHLTLPDLLGRGMLMLTLDMGDKTNRYQGIVELTGANLSDAIRGYFTQSQQAEVAVKLSSGQRKDETGDIRWYAGGIMIERLPNEGGYANEQEREMHTLEEGDTPQDQWNRSELFMKSIREGELLDPHLTSGALLFRLFNEDGVWVYDPQKLSVTCRCSRDRITRVLRTIPQNEVEEMLVRGKLSINCQFCNKSEKFNAGDVEKIYR